MEHREILKRRSEASKKGWQSRKKMAATQKRAVFIILDGAASEGPCGLSECFEKAAGTYEILDADTNEFLGSVQLCKKHGMQLVTGVSA